jgi:hypothetical protein
MRRSYSRIVLRLPIDLIPVSLAPNPTIEAYKPGVDQTLFLENLKLNPHQRVLKMLGALEFVEALQASRKASKP